MSHLSGIDHVNILTTDIAACRQFYVEVLGFTEGYRPEFDFAGMWLYLGDQAVVHVVVVAEGSAHKGNIDHVAFKAHDFKRFGAKLDERDIEYRHTTVPGTDVHQLFLTDPDGVKLEFNFADVQVRGMWGTHI